MTDKHIEVELRALVKDLNLVKQSIDTEGAKFIGSSSLHDIYFCPKSVDTIEETEMNEVGSFSLRLRKYTNENNSSISINTKTIIAEGDHSAWEEHEIKVDDFSEAFKILTSIGFKPFFQLEKTRFEYELDGIGIFLEDIKDFGAGIEVEIITDESQKENAKGKLMDFLSKIGVTQEDIVPKSITNIVMKQRAFKSKIQL